MKKEKLGILIPVLTVVIVISLLSISNLDIQELKPPEDAITSSVIYGEPLTLKQLKEGLDLSGGWNVFRWTEELNKSIPVQEALSSLSNNYFYVYDYSAQKFFFNPNQKLADYKDQGYYKNRVFSELEPGKRYAVYMIKNKIKLQYEVPEIEEEEEIEELREEKGLLNDVWFWIILIIIILLLYKRKIWKLKK